MEVMDARPARRVVVVVVVAMNGATDPECFALFDGRGGAVLAGEPLPRQPGSGARVEACEVIVTVMTPVIR
ncbi:hypothetical protein E2C01_055800 [Portunus trituberculatus]|uniref:Uncharacterized protein n=1 Tax=Portunus trituberculatus TaxID=210409 RepID=A0A5B7GVQ6_PORTR|nr:hypothetical protein [Portunus trituberculatus]